MPDFDTNANLRMTLHYEVEIWQTILYPGNVLLFNDDGKHWF